MASDLCDESCITSNPDLYTSSFAYACLVSLVYGVSIVVLSSVCAEVSHVPCTPLPAFVLFLLLLRRFCSLFCNRRFLFLWRQERTVLTVLVLAKRLTLNLISRENTRCLTFAAPNPICTTHCDPGLTPLPLSHVTAFALAAAAFTVFLDRLRRYGDDRCAGSSLTQGPRL